MKTMMNKLSKLSLLAIVSLMSACSGDDEPKIEAPIASFQFTVDGLSVTFTNGSKDGETFAWDFGDNVGTSTDESPTYTYTTGGTFTVKLTATNGGGSDDSEKEVTVQSLSAENMIQNGGFDDDSNWTAQQFNLYANASISIADGALTIGEVNPDATWGAEAHGGVWQAVTVPAGTYVFDYDVVTVDADELWSELWIGSVEPVAEDDYNGDDDATVILKLNTWDCGDTQKNYSGSLNESNCNGDNPDGTITLEAGTYYVVIRTGGIVFPAAGVIIDNVSMLASE